MRIEAKACLPDFVLLFLQDPYCNSYDLNMFCSNFHMPLLPDRKLTRKKDQVQGQQKDPSKVFLAKYKNFKLMQMPELMRLIMLRP